MLSPGVDGDVAMLITLSEELEQALIADLYIAARQGNFVVRIDAENKFAELLAARPSTT